MKKSDKILVAGASGMVGSAIAENLISKGYTNIYGTYNRRKINFSDKIKYIKIDLRNSTEVDKLLKDLKVKWVFLAAAKVGGIVANNTYRAQFIYENLQIQNNIIHGSYINKVEKLLFLGSSCIYPKNCPQPMKEEHLLSSPLEYTNEPYAIAKIAGIKMCESYNLQYGTNFISVMPTNLYGKNDNFDLEKSHVIPALIRKIHLAKCLENNDYNAIIKDFNDNPCANSEKYTKAEEINELLAKYGIVRKNGKVELSLWGSGTPEREFLHADDLADACTFLMENIDFKDILKNDHGIEKAEYPITQKNIRNTHINIGTGKDLSIKELALHIKENVVGFKGDIKWDTSKPDGTMKKLLSADKLKSMGWRYKKELKEELKNIYSDY